MKNSSGKPRGGAVRKGVRGKQVGSGGQGRQALEGRGPTPKAEDRPYHPAGKAKASKERYDAASTRRGGPGSDTGAGRRGPASTEGGRRGAPGADGGRRGAPGTGGRDPESRPARSRRTPQSDETEIVTGRNSVVEALRTKVPATALYIASRVEVDARVREILSLAGKANIPLLEVMRPELDRLAGRDAVHQGVALKVPAYEYADPIELLDRVLASGATPLLVALDGITDPRNLGAIIRSTGAFGGQGVIVPQRRSVGLTASAWKTSAGAAARVPVAMAGNLTQTVKALKQRGVFVLGLDGGGDTELSGLTFATDPVLLIVGSEGKGLSRLITENCDAIVSIPISATTESLNAGIATSVALYEISKLRAERR